MPAIHEFIEAYRAAWERVIQGRSPITELDSYFAEPCLMLSATGEAAFYETAAAVTAFNQTRLDAFRKGRVERARLRGVDVTGQGPHLSLAVVNWELICGDGALERSWRHYYTIQHDAGAAPRILVSAFQLGS